MRKAIRLQGFNYGSDGGYFITVLSYKRQKIFSEIIDSKVMLSALGKIITEEWENTARLRPYVSMGELVVMPDHIHGIIFINKNPDGIYFLESENPQFPIDYKNKRGGQRENLGSIMRGFKSAVTSRAIHEGIQLPVWHRNYYDRIIQTKEALEEITAYIHENPLRWEKKNARIRRTNPFS